MLRLRVCVVVCDVAVDVDNVGVDAVYADIVVVAVMYGCYWFAGDYDIVLVVQRLLVVVSLLLVFM